MAKSSLFEYAILFHPKSKKDKEGNESSGKSEILIAPKTVLAKDDKEVAILAARELPEKYLDKLEQVDIIVRPF